MWGAFRAAVVSARRHDDLATLGLADRILVLDAGGICDLGSHRELIVRGELYRRLYHESLKSAA